MICSTTAMLRPELLEQTYSSFSKRFYPFPKSLVISFSPLQRQTEKEVEETLNECINICKKYFKKVEWCVLRNPTHAKAIKWVWYNINKKNDYVLHLEDDWLLNFDVNVKDLDLSKDECVLRSYIRKDFQFMLSPSIIKSSFCSKVIMDMPDNSNPENYIRKNFNYDITAYPDDLGKIIVQDLGEKWKKNNNYCWAEENYDSFSTLKTGKQRKNTLQAVRANISMGKYK